MYFWRHTIRISMRWWLIRLSFWVLPLSLAYGQCAMCRKNAEAAQPGFLRGLRVGIGFLFVMPYLIAGLMGWLWYKRFYRYDRMEAGGGDQRSEPASRTS